MSYIAQIKLDAISILCLRGLFLTDDVRFEPAATCLYLRYSVSYIKIKFRHFVTYEDDFIKIKIYINLNLDMRINTLFKNTLTNYNKSDILTKKLVLLPVDFDENSRLFIGY